MHRSIYRQIHLLIEFVDLTKIELEYWVVGFSIWKKKVEERNRLTWTFFLDRIGVFSITIWKKKRVVRGGAPFSQSVRRRKRRKSRQNDASCFATASRERGSSANPSFASVYGALSISPNWYLVVNISIGGFSPCNNKCLRPTLNTLFEKVTCSNNNSNNKKY